MKLLFLGSASGLVRDAKNFQSNMLLITDKGKKLLIDCGTDIRFSLLKADYLPRDIDAVYVSHLHADHIGGLEWLALQRKFVAQNGGPELIIHEQLIDRMWDHSLSGGLKTLQEKEATLNDYFKVCAVKDKEHYEWDDLQLYLVKTVHVHSNKKLLPSYGLEIKYKGKFFFITTDAQFTLERFEDYYHRASLIFHDCETMEIPSGVHAHFNELNTLDPAIKAKMWLYHYNDGTLPDAATHGFLGFIHCGQVVELN